MASGLGDPIEIYLSVLSAIENLGNAPILGEVLNGIVPDEYEEEDGRNPEGGKGPGPEMTLWAGDLGVLLAHAAHYTAFACEGIADVAVSKYDYDREGTITSSALLYLRVLRGEETIAAWPLNAPLPVDELLAFCTPAHFGDLRTQTTILEPSVRAAMEIPVSAICDSVPHASR